ncbi:copper chaperone PCu(A)C [Rubrivivax benzoatilyticus]|uniref:Copper chaperone PCu(A)C n=1 Tax=Rubrivivax benzoatilyticus TaxID=316997 RepID=A0ABX0I0L5_9BURK|nr:copper chaperone PCu(A)C [Rubrivivax benzoatilyticus]EGJ11428.1 copper(I)-binding protein [Rubrivivax benzoatilyticus JA2 = ATCC BAA-35]NHL00241.1 copper chaperone PCu(A)C [Rubrivivax benzoatilyticus]NHL26164.1 copper chaperone PCu(A)C [Rubrivivax benzoatilyticus]
MNILDTPTRTPLTRRHFGLLLAAAAWAGGARAHGTRAGDLVVDHPYATPTPAGLTTGAVYFRVIENRGHATDRLLGATTPRAARVEIHRSTMDGNVMRMRAIEALDLPAGASVRLRHGEAGAHLMLFGLSGPLRDGERFPLTLRFEHAGNMEANVWVQTPRDGHVHKH